MNPIVKEVAMKTGRFCIFAVVASLGLMIAAICIAGRAGPFYPIQEYGLLGYMDQEGKAIWKAK